MSLKIYTKTGDAGKTSLLGGTRVSKSNIRIAAYGDIDELNSFIGLLADQYPDETGRAMLKEIQDRLFTIGSALACDPQKEIALKIPDLREEDVLLLEKEIDRMSGILPPMKSFILPGGHPVVSTAHICRCVCRRAERMTVQLDAEEPIGQILIIKYLNRLSDYLFILARYAGHLLGSEEIPWVPRNNLKI
ncbi:MAG: cob(I)yrinic acid a,c-diamide adenosyltransferase [Bacteroidota bacterium]|nr:cob(I)yrinic acid a,c-diamide adenosyltransferase [Bacteroidota bacterium]